MENLERIHGTTSIVHQNRVMMARPREQREQKVMHVIPRFLPCGGRRLPNRGVRLGRLESFDGPADRPCYAHRGPSSDPLVVFLQCMHISSTISNKHSREMHKSVHPPMPNSTTLARPGPEARVVPTRKRGLGQSLIGALKQRIGTKAILTHCVEDSSI
jgi:hypothetical protein